MSKLLFARGLAAALLLGASASAAHAQIFTPTFMAPQRRADVGVYLSDFAGGLGAEGIFRFGGRSFDLGLRGGFVDVGDGALTLGAEVRSPLAVRSAPLSLALTLGAQGIFGDVDAAGFQGGLSVGHSFAAEGIVFTPYVHPRVGVLNRLGADDELDVELLADLGFDLDFRPNLSVRFGAELEGPGADWGLGISWRR